MQRHPFFKVVTFFLVAIVVISAVLAGAPVSQAQSPTPTQANTTTDDSDELPIYINITGTVQSITATALTINNLTIHIPSGMTLPSGIAVGKPVSLHGNLLDDDTVILITIVFGYHLPTSTPAGSATPLATTVATPVATAQPTLEATDEATVPATLPASADCNKPHQSLGVMLSAAYRVSYDDVIRLHCEGYAFGVIARGYLLVFAGKDAGKDLSIDTILVLRLKGHGWHTIILLLGVQPDSTLVILILNGGHATVLFDCGSGITLKHAALCTGISVGGSGGGNGGGDDQGDNEGGD